MKHCLLALLMIATFCAAPIAAQSVTGTILGTVTDPGGALIPDVQVIATNTLTGDSRTARTDGAGNYVFPSLPVGVYRVEAQASGFKRTVRDGITLEVNRNARVDLGLQLGEVAEQVSVVGDAPVVDTFQVQMGALVDSKRTADLPLNGRNVYSLLQMLPGVNSASAPTVHSREGNTIRVNGSRTRHNTFMLDGGFNNSHWRNAGNASPTPDAIQEFRLITNNYNAEFGRSSGAVVNVLTKSGTNNLHGTLFHFLRNDKLNARNFFQPTVPPLRQNQFGGVLGGPVIRNRTFFFGSYENLLIRSNQFRNTARTPTAAERRGDFSASPASSRPIDPLTRQPFPGGIIPADRLDPVAMNIINQMVPLPNTPDGRLEALRPAGSDQWQTMGKLDHVFTSAHRLSATFFYMRNKTDVPFQGGATIPDYSPHVTNYDQQNLVVNETWAITPTLLNEARVIYTRHFFNDVPTLRKGWSDFGSDIPLAAEFHRPYAPQFFIQGRWNMGAHNENLGQTDDTIGIGDTVSWTRGGHNVKFGGYYGYNRYTAQLALSGNGQIRIGGEFTNNALADFMTGNAASFRMTNGTNRAMRKWEWFGFVQDDWKIHRRVTLNLGLRYELYPWWYSQLGDLQTFRPGVQSEVIPSAPRGLLFEGDPGVPKAMARTDKNNWAPRLGIAVDPFGDGRTAIRAGWGLFYTTSFADAATYLQNQPFQIDYTIFGTTGFRNPYAGLSDQPFRPFDPANPFFLYPLLGSYMDENLAIPYVQHFNFAIERQLFGNMSLQVAYVGNVSRKLLYQTDFNQPLFGPGATAGNINARRPIQPGVIGQISHNQSGANASYNSLQITANKRFARGFSLQANYTWGKAIDEISEDNFNPVNVALVDSFNRAYDRAVSSGDVRHSVNFSYVWELPGLRSLGGLGRYVLGGWQLNGVLRLNSGRPFTVTAGRDVNLNGVGNDRPDLIGDPDLPSGRSRAERIAQYFDPSAFRESAPGTLGSAGRNILFGPGSVHWDQSFFKNIPMPYAESHTLQFRGEFFNFPNIVNFNNPVSNIRDRNAGRILSADSGRVIQFGLRYSF